MIVSAPTPMSSYSSFNNNRSGASPILSTQTAIEIQTRPSLTYQLPMAQRQPKRYLLTMHDIHKLILCTIFTRVWRWQKSQVVKQTTTGWPKLFWKNVQLTRTFLQQKTYNPYKFAFLTVQNRTIFSKKTVQFPIWPLLTICHVFFICLVFIVIQKVEFYPKKVIGRPWKPNFSEIKKISWVLKESPSWETQTTVGAKHKAARITYL